jgi:hypothetical protein
MRVHNREVIDLMVEYKREIDLLLRRDFFRSLLLLYEDIKGVGLEEYMNLGDCCEQKKALLVHLIGQMNGAKLKEIGKKMAKTLNEMEFEDESFGKS